MTQEKEVRHAEWCYLRIAGRPLLTSFTAGETPLLWVACRASPRLVHIFCDSQLKITWRFSSDPVFISLKRGIDAFVKTKYLPLNCETLPVLLVITQDGCIRLLPVCLPERCPERPPICYKPPKKRKKRSKQEADKHHKEEWDLFDDLDVYENMECADNNTNKFSSSSKSMLEGSAEKEIKKHSFSKGERVFFNVKPLSVSVHPKFSHNAHSVLASEEYLVGTVHNACFANFAPENMVFAFSEFGLERFHLQVLEEGLSSFEKLDSVHNDKYLHSKTTCAFVLTSSSNALEDTSGHSMLHDKLYSAFFDTLIGERPECMLIRGDLDGNVSLSPFHGKSIDLSLSVVLCNLGEPILSLFFIPSGNDCHGLNVSFEKAKERRARSKLQIRDTLLIVGQFGHVLALTCNYATGHNTCFISSSYIKDEVNLMLNTNTNNFEIRDWKVDAQLTSACMIGFQHLCYCNGSEVFVSLLFEDNSRKFDIAKMDIPKHDLNSQSVFNPTRADEQSMNTRSSEHARFILRDILCPRKISVADPVIFVAGKDCSISNVYGRPLVVLTARGRILGVDISHSVLTGVMARKTWRSWESNMEEHVESLINTVDKISSSCDRIQQHNNSLNLAIRELADSLKVAALILGNMNKGNVVRLAQRNTSFCNKGLSLRCSFEVAPCPITILPYTKVAFESKATVSDVDYAEYILCNEAHIPSRITVTLHNCTSFLLSSHWTLVLELQESGSTKGKVSVYSSLINNGMGLSSGSQCSLEFDVKLPSLHAGPVDVYAYLCHVHDEHERIYKGPSVDNNNKDSMYKSLQSLQSVDESNIERLFSMLSFDGTDDASSANNSHTDAFGSILIPLSQYKIDILSLARKLPERCQQKVNARFLDQRCALHNDEIAGKTCYENILGPFSGTLKVCNSTWEEHSETRKDVRNLWKELFSDDFWQKGTVSKGGDKITFMLPGGEVFSLLLKNVFSQEIQLHIEAPTFLLACLLREALIWRLKHGKGTKNFQNKISSAVKRGDRVTNLTDKSHEVKEQLEMILDRAKELLFIWNERKSQKMIDSQEILPALRDIHCIVKDTLALYRSQWEV